MEVSVDVTVRVKIFVHPRKARSAKVMIDVAILRDPLQQDVLVDEQTTAEKTGARFLIKKTKDITGTDEIIGTDFTINVITETVVRKEVVWKNCKGQVSWI
jgi:hypothetical protein